MINEVYGYSYNNLGRVLTINQIIKRFRTEGRCVKFSPQTIMHMARILGFTKKQVGGKIGYDKSLITAITQRFNDAMEYESKLHDKPSQKPLERLKTPPTNYYMMNGERDNRDYDWEVDENTISRYVNEAINLVLEGKILQGDLFTSEFTDEPIKKAEKELAKKKNNEKRREARLVKKEKEDKKKRIEQYRKDSKRMLNGGLFRKEDFK
jgi:hypothetical protein